jgi:hypothetical protein
MVRVVSKINAPLSANSSLNDFRISYFMDIFGNSTKYAQPQATRMIRRAPQIVIILHMESYPDFLRISSMKLNAPEKIWNFLFAAPSLVFI